jgi:hypothetical protein
MPDDDKAVRRAAFLHHFSSAAATTFYSLRASGFEGIVFYNNVHRPHLSNDGSQEPQTSLSCCQEKCGCGYSCLTKSWFTPAPNGDRWYLVPDNADPEQWKVRHQPNRASGGRPTTVDIGEFLAEGQGPQHEALQRHLRQLGHVPPSE